jgi:hypothetical protein
MILVAGKNSLLKLSLEDARKTSPTPRKSGRIA